MSAPHRLGLNESAYPPLPAVAAALRDWAVEAHRYPEFRPDGLRSLIADHLGVPPGRVTVGAGATAVIAQVIATCTRANSSGGIPSIVTPSIVTSVPTFDGYPILAELAGMRVIPVPLNADGGHRLDALLDAIDPTTRLIALSSPHNPTGAVIDDAELVEMLGAIPSDVVVILDQAYIEYADAAPDAVDLIGRFPNLVVIRTFSKAYGLAGLRVGYGFGGSVIGAIREHEMPFGVGSAASAAVPVALSARAELAERVRAMRVQRERLRSMLADIGMATPPSQANCLLLPGAEGHALGETLRTCGVDTKDCGPAGRRITVADRAGVDYVIAALRAVALSA